MKFTNPSGNTINLGPLGLGMVKPGATVEIPDHMARPGVRQNGSRMPSDIENQAPQLIPADPEEEKAWRKTPVPASPARKPTAAAAPAPLNAPPGVLAAIQARQADEDAPQAPTGGQAAPRKPGRPPKVKVEAPAPPAAEDAPPAPPADEAKE